MKTIQINGQPIPLDDSRAITTFVSLFTEDAAIEGIVHIGVGHFLAGMNNENLRVVDDVHLRMTPEVALRMAGLLTRLANVAKRQQADMQNMTASVRN